MPPRPAARAASLLLPVAPRGPTVLPAGGEQGAAAAPDQARVGRPARARRMERLGHGRTLRVAIYDV